LGRSGTVSADRSAAAQARIGARHHRPEPVPPCPWPKPGAYRPFRPRGRTMACHSGSPSASSSISSSPNISRMRIGVDDVLNGAALNVWTLREADAPCKNTALRSFLFQASSEPLGVTKRRMIRAASPDLAEDRGPEGFRDILVRESHVGRQKTPVRSGPGPARPLVAGRADASAGATDRKDALTQIGLANRSAKAACDARPVLPGIAFLLGAGKQDVPLLQLAVGAASM
jgi:hypothetical protein